MKNSVRVPFAALIFLIAAFFSGQAFAQAGKAITPEPSPAPPAAKMGFESAELLRILDVNRDGMISQKEWDDFFADHDQDGDKRLATEEIEASFKLDEQEESQTPDYGLIAALERLDKNHDGAIDAPEWPGKTKDFQYLDANHNGSISREEFLSVNSRWWNLPFESLDFNGDKVIIRSEWLDTKASFDRLDRNKNGAIDRREFYRPR